METYMSKTKKTVYRITIAVLVASLVLQVIIGGFHQIGLYIIFGFLGAWVFMLFAKRILSRLLERDGNYYDGGNDEPRS